MPSLVLSTPDALGTDPHSTLTLRDVDELGELFMDIRQAAELVNFCLSRMEAQDDRHDHPMTTVLREALTERTAAIRAAAIRADAILDQAPAVTKGAALRAVDDDTKGGA